MSAPTIVVCAADTWVKVVTSVLSARVWFLINSPLSYLYTFVATGAAAPVGLTKAVIAPLGDSDKGQPSLEFGSAELSDLYIYARSNAGSVLVDAGAGTAKKGQGFQFAEDLDLPQATTQSYYLLLENRTGFSFQFIPDPDGAPPAPDGNTKVTIHASDQDDGTVTVLASLDYTDVTGDWGGSAEITAEDFFIFDTRACVYAVRIDVTRGAGVGTEDYTLRARVN